MALATLQLAAIPLLAGLAAGTGAVASYVTAPDGTTTSNSAVGVTMSQPDLPCAAQTWPYVDRACADGSAEAPRERRAIRVVTAPRPSDAFEKRWTDIAPALAAANALTPAPAAAPAGLTTSDTALRQPQNLAAIDAPAAAPPKKKTDTRRDTQRKRGNERMTAQSYRVPSERGGDMRQPVTREVIVVRPLFDFFR